MEKKGEIMAVSMRLKKCGNKNNHFFRLVVADARSPRDGKFIEEIGWYNPYTEETVDKVSVKEERAIYWLGQGVKVSPTVKNLLKAKGIKF
jgi:small subunit ribosomal protein S16